MESSYLVFDLETVGLSLDAFDETQHEYLFRRAETEADRERVVNELSLSPMTGRIVTIGMRMMKRDGAGHEWTAKDVAYQVDPAMTDSDAVREHPLPSGGMCYFSSERVMLRAPGKSFGEIGCKWRSQAATRCVRTSPLLQVISSRAVRSRLNA